MNINKVHKNKGCCRILRSNWKMFKVLMSREKALKGNAQTIQKIERINFIRCTGGNLFFGIKGLIWGGSINKTIQTLMEFAEKEANKPNSTF